MSKQQRSSSRKAPEKDKKSTQPSLSSYEANLQKAPRRVDWKRLPKSTIVILLLVILGLGGWLITRNASSLREKSLDNGLYSYKLRFYNGASPVDTEGYKSLKFSTTVIGTVRPTSDTYLRDCAQIGGTWRQMFEARIEGEERPVCSQNGLTFYTNYEHMGSRHMITLTYREVQNADKYPALKDIIQSIKTSKN